MAIGIFETTKINFAVFLCEAKGLAESGHRFNERGLLLIVFDNVDLDKLVLWEHQYINSPWHRADMRRMTWLRLMKPRGSRITQSEIDPISIDTTEKSNSETV